MQKCENCGSLNQNKIQICEVCGEEISSSFVIKHSDYEDLVEKLESEDRNNILKISLNHQDENLKYYESLSREKTHLKTIQNMRREQQNFTYLHKQYPDESIYNIGSDMVKEEFSKFVDGSYLKPSKITIILIIISIIWILYYCFKY